MTRCYLDTSAAAKLLVAESGSAAVAAWLDQPDVQPMATLLLETELRRLAVRLEVSQQSVSGVLEGVELFALPDTAFREAGLMSGRDLRSLDALHLVGALRLDVDVLVTYDQRLAVAAADVGLIVVAPA
ncbi:type II toxin-antitoxin system VapC family toxin [Nocardioides hankookensis]|uniref:Type II toxin-antitoxin system VapC family toxin n=1 Tax=Nocardioides hankookensis TaxID=443157 RepID=A0ABW1LRI5_9ACTN